MFQKVWVVPNRVVRVWAEWDALQCFWMVSLGNRTCRPTVVHVPPGNTQTMWTISKGVILSTGYVSHQSRDGTSEVSKYRGLALGKWSFVRWFPVDSSEKTGFHGFTWKFREICGFRFPCWNPQISFKWMVSCPFSGLGNPWISSKLQISFREIHKN